MTRPHSSVQPAIVLGVVDNSPFGQGTQVELEPSHCTGPSPDQAGYPAWVPLPAPADLGHVAVLELSPEMASVLEDLRRLLRPRRDDNRLTEIQRLYQRALAVADSLVEAPVGSFGTKQRAYDTYFGIRRCSPAGMALALGIVATALIIEIELATQNSLAPVERELLRRGIQSAAAEVLRHASICALSLRRSA